MELVQFFGADRAITFMLLFARLSGLVVFFPFFSHNQVPLTVKTLLVLAFTIIFFPLAKVSTHEINFLVFEILSELLLGLCAGLLINIIFTMLSFAGEQISMVMGFSMASVMDPTSGLNSPVISNILNFMAILTFLFFDGHHLLIQFYAASLDVLPLGDFYPREGVGTYTIKAVYYLYMFGFILAFPIIALSLLSDVIFGMLMKTMPQFNLLVIGYPIKIAIGFSILIAILAGMLKIFSILFQKGFNDLPSLFF
ncbi:MAG: flagellar type III secretion system protein FliR [Campylobacter sp.]|nr:flagellar type III secretion system protein FliR [Campylobacter sp.]